MSLMVPGRQRVPVICSGSFIKLPLQPFIGILETEDHVDTRQVEAVLQEVADLPQPLKVVFAIEAGAALAAGRS